MTPDQGWRLLLLEVIRRLPADLIAVISLTASTILVVYLPGAQDTQIRIGLGLLFVLFLPGYAFIAALFPETDNSPDSGRMRVSEDRGINGIERIALAVGMSLTLVPLLGLGLNFTPWGIRFTPVILSLSGFTIGCTAIAALRRWRLPSEERFSVSYREWVAAAGAEVFKPDNRTDTVLNVVLALLVLLALGSIGFAVAAPQQDNGLTEFYLLTEDDDGELVTDNYPEEFVQGETQSVIVGSENQEHETVEYTVVVQLERVKDDRARTEVIERDELDRFDMTLAHDETQYTEHEIAPTMVGENLQLTYLLYKGEPPEKPTSENSYRDLHLSITVHETEIQDPIEITDREINTQKPN